VRITQSPARRGNHVPLRVTPIMLLTVQVAYDMCGGVGWTRLLWALYQRGLERAPTAREAARIVVVSKRNFQRKFIVSTGRSYKQFILQWKMANARELLSGGELTVGEVARLTGYRSHTAFSRAFRRFYGVCPGCFMPSRSTSLTDVA
jgi:AraC-like DNA-binding protein